MNQLARPVNAVASHFVAWFDPLFTVTGRADQENDDARGDEHSFEDVHRKNLRFERTQGVKSANGRTANTLGSSDRDAESQTNRISFKEFPFSLKPGRTG